jgi:MoaA/NifB/PqqE/SkfB family radical SAM enzyme
MPNSDRILSKKTGLVSLNLDLTTVCNANCLFCNYGIKKEKPLFLSEMEYKRFLDLLRGQEFEHISLTPQTGDITLHKDFVRFIHLIKEYDIQSLDGVYFYTNAIALDEDIINELLRTQVTKIIISISGFRENEYRNIFQSGYYHRVISNILSLCNIKSRHNFKTEIIIDFKGSDIASNLKSEEYEKLLQPFHRKGIMQFSESKELFDFPDLFTPNSTRRSKIVENKIPINLDTRLGKLELLLRRLFPCYHLSKLAIRPNGSLRLCNCVFSSIPSNHSDGLGVGHVPETDRRRIAAHANLAITKWTKGILPNRCGVCQMYAASTTGVLVGKWRRFAQ